MIKRLKNAFSKLSITKIGRIIKKRNHFEYLDKKYDGKVNLFFLREMDNLKIQKLIKEDNIVAYKNEKEIIGVSKNIEFNAITTGNLIIFRKIENISLTKNSLRNIYEIKKFNSFLIDFAKKNGYKEIIINTWLFEQFPGFNKYLGGYVVDNINVLKQYKKILQIKNIKKVLSFDFNKAKLKCLTNNGEIIYILNTMPAYTLRV